MKIYSSSENDFSKNGYGFLRDCLSAKVNESLNGDDILELEYPVNGKLSEHLVEGNIIKTNVGNNNEQLFRIARVTKDFDEIQVYALHISYDLINNMLVDVYPQNLSCQAFGTWLLNHTQFTSPFTFYSDITASKSARYVRKNPIEAILGSADNSMINLFGGELERDNFTLKFLSQRGNNNHVKLITGKNITEIQTKIDITTLYTRLMPIGFDGLILPEKFVDSPLINNYPTPRIGKVEFDNIKYDPNSTEEGVYTNIEDAYAALRNAANELFAQGIDKPKVSISVDWLELSKTEQYKNQFAYLERVNLGDTITANILGLDYTTRVVKTIYNVLTDTIDKFEIGTLESNITNTINNNQRKIEEINPSSILQQATQQATELITSAMGGYVYKTNNELYIMDTDNPSTAQKVWRWNINGLGYSSTGINGPYGLAMTMDGAIVADFITTGVLNTNVIQGYDSLTLQVSTNTSDIATIKAEISDIADITTSANSDTAFINSSELQNIAVSNPIRVEIHPINTNISYLYPSIGLFPSNTTYLKIRTLKFTNTSTNETFNYVLPTDLLYYDSDNYDTFVADYETDLVTITKKCGYNADGTTYLLNEPVITTYSYTDTFKPYFELTQGNYQIELPGYSEGFIFVRLMVLNAYTAQYATKVELNNAINLTTTEISSYVDAQITDVNGEITDIRGDLSLKLGKNEYGTLISMLNASADEITLDGGSKINLNTPGKLLISSGNFKLDEYGSITATNANLNDVVIDGGNVELYDDGTENSVLVYSNTGEHNVRPLQINDDISGKYVKLGFPNNFSGSTTGVSISHVPLISFENGSIRYRHGYQYENTTEVWLHSSTEDTIIYYSNDQTQEVTTNLTKIKIPEGFGKVTYVDENLINTSNNKLLSSYITFDFINADNYSAVNCYGLTIKNEEISTNYSGSGLTINTSSGNCDFNSNGISWNTPYGIDYTDFEVNQTAMIYNTPTSEFYIWGGSGGEELSYRIGQTNVIDANSSRVKVNNLEQTSSEFRKKNFEKFEDNALKIINDIEIYKYHLKEQDDTEKKHIGFVIGDKYKYSKEVTSNDNENVDLYSFISVCCKAIQEQNKLIEEQQKEIEILKQEIKSIKESE